MDREGKIKERHHGLGDKYIWGEGKMGQSWGARWVSMERNTHHQLKTFPVCFKFQFSLLFV